MHGRRGRQVGVVAATIAVALVLAACNPLVNQQTVDSTFGGPTPTTSRRMDFTGSEGGWLEVRVTAATGDAVTAVSSGMYPNGDCTPQTFGTAPVWDGGGSAGFARVGWIEPGAYFQVHMDGTDDVVTYDIRVVDGTGNPVGDITPRAPTNGPFTEIGWPIC